MTQLVIVGAGGFGRETLDVIEAINGTEEAPTIDVIGVLDDSPSPLALRRLAARGTAFLGGIESWLQGAPDIHYLVCIGNPQARAAIDRRFRTAGLEAATVIHPRSTIGSLAIIAPGTIVCSGAEISTNVTFGRHTHVNPNATIGHDTIMADYVSVNPGATVSGEVSIGREVLIGAGAVVLQGLTIGDRSVIGASSCVTRDVAHDVVVKGVPAR